MCRLSKYGRYAAVEVAFGVQPCHIVPFGVAALLEFLVVGCDICAAAVVGERAGLNFY